MIDQYAQPESTPVSKKNASAYIAAVAAAEPSQPFQQQTGAGIATGASKP